MKETYLSYHYQNLMKKTEWLYVTPTESDFSPEIITQECGRFFFDGQSYTILNSATTIPTILLEKPETLFSSTAQKDIV